MLNLRLNKFKFYFDLNLKMFIILSYIKIDSNFKYNFFENCPIIDFIIANYIQSNFIVINLIANQS